jgi:hypothetical protein
MRSCAEQDEALEMDVPGTKEEGVEWALTVPPLRNGVETRPARVSVTGTAGAYPGRFITVNSPPSAS